MAIETASTKGSPTWRDVARLLRLPMKSPRRMTSASRHWHMLSLRLNTNTSQSGRSGWGVGPNLTAWRRWGSRDSGDFAHRSALQPSIARDTSKSRPLRPRVPPDAAATPGHPPTAPADRSMHTVPATCGQHLCTEDAARFVRTDACCTARRPGGAKRWGEDGTFQARPAGMEERVLGEVPARPITWPPAQPNESILRGHAPQTPSSVLPLRALPIIQRTRRRGLCAAPLSRESHLPLFHGGAAQF